MTSAGRRGRSVGAPRVGLFGRLGSGNIGNDASMEAVLAYLRAEHPDAILDAMCGGPERLRDVYGITGIPLFWYQRYEHREPGVTAAPLKMLGKGFDVVRTAAWVRRHDVVIVPGMGVLEATLPTRAMGFPFALLLLTASGRVFGTKVALVSVGANVINRRLTRWLSTSAARLAFYRSYRDAQSRDAMRARGLDTSRDRVYPDLAFALPAIPHDAGDQRTVGVGVMEYQGTDDDDRRHADEIYASYLENIKRFVRWLVDNDRRVRLLVGDRNDSDDHVVQEILADLRAHRPDLEPAQVVAEPVVSFADLMQEMASVGTVVATRYHNVLCALRLSKPTVSLGYAAKHRALMADMGLAEFCQSTSSLDVDLLIEQCTELENRSAQLRRTMAERNAENARLLDDQFAVLSAVLFPDAKRAAAAAEREPAGSDIP
jgi:polysaccharide pyruvyl transferase WcaK-like protein